MLSLPLIPHPGEKCHPTGQGGQNGRHFMPSDFPVFPVSHWAIQSGWRLSVPRGRLMGEVRTWVEPAAFPPGMGNPGRVSVCGIVADVAHFCLSSPDVGAEACLK